MPRRATFTQAELDRAIIVAEKRGREVAIIGGIIRIVEPGAFPPLPSPEADAGNTCDEVFGERSG